MKEVKSKFKLTDFLRDIKIGEQCKIYSVAYKTGVVRSSVARLNNEGYEFKMTERGCMDGCFVTRYK